MKNILIYGDSDTWGYDSARYMFIVSAGTTQCNS